MTREEAENRINDLAWQIRDVILEYDSSIGGIVFNISPTSELAFTDENGQADWLVYWTCNGQYKIPLEVHCPIPSEKMIRYRESLKEEEHDPES